VGCIIHDQPGRHACSAALEFIINHLMYFTNMVLTF